MNKNVLIALLIVIIAVLAFVAFKPKEGVTITPIPVQQNKEAGTEQNISTERKIPGQGSLVGWKVTQGQDNQAFYSDTWVATREQGGYLFTLPSGNFINWKDNYNGGTCVQQEKFVYGVSSTACVSGWIAYTGVKDVRSSATQADLNDFGDFVLKNQ